MRTAHTVTEVRAAEAALMATVPDGTLMQRAAAGLATACVDYLGGTYGRSVVVVAGSGDNGGDALYAGARLASRGVRVGAVVLDRAKVHQGGLAALLAAGGRVVDGSAYDRAIAQADLVLDGIVGIGGKPGLRPAAAAVMDLVEADGVPVVAVDVPSGIDVDTGEAPERHVRAAVTVTFGTHKIGLFVDPGATAAGVVHFVDIGLGPYLPEPAVEALQAADVAALLPVPEREAHKYSRGVVGVVAGSRQYTGAAVLAVGGALGGPAGMVRYAGPAEPARYVRQRWPEAVVGEGRVQAWVVGSGLGSDPERAGDVPGILAGGVPVIVDADGLRWLPDRCDGQVLLTPHEGELGRMLGVDRVHVAAHRLASAREAARRWNATVLLKGASTLVAAPDGRVRVNTVGTSWLATAGSGDVLSGLCGSLLAAGLDPLDAGSVGAYLHATAGVLASRGGPIAAQDIARHLPEAYRLLLGGS
ncbi:NAD(P)H-hydrate dehydratase [Actinopolymorpha sp. B9G3]|uniref:NAD(P)H-hydrate dehydratase n=1 Tax=Actinopolymorpha sp. B9G3 TaxID=3158970 RepID=UPI0032D9AC69